MKRNDAILEIEVKTKKFVRAFVLRPLLFLFRGVRTRVLNSECKIVKKVILQIDVFLII